MLTENRTGSSYSRGKDNSKSDVVAPGIATCVTRMRGSELKHSNSRQITAKWFEESVNVETLRNIALTKFVGDDWKRPRQRAVEGKRSGRRTK